MVIWKRQLWRNSLVLAVLCLIPRVAWSYRNLVYQDNFSLSTNGSFTLLYYKSVAIESHVTVRDPDHYTASAAREKIMREMAVQRIACYPLWTVIMTGISLAHQLDPDPGLALPVSLQIAITGLELVLGAVGAWHIFKQYNWLFLVVIGSMILYYAGVTSLVHGGLYNIRHRMPNISLMPMYNGVGTVYVFEHLVGQHRLVSGRPWIT